MFNTMFSLTSRHVLSGYSALKVGCVFSDITSCIVWSPCVGLMPYNFLCVEAGCVLSDITSTGDILTTSAMLKLLAAAAATLVPSLLVRHCKRSRKTDWRGDFPSGDGRRDGRWCMGRDGRWFLTLFLLSCFLRCVGIVLYGWCVK